MNVTNSETIDAYNLAYDKYIEASPQFISDALQTWIDDSIARLDGSAKILEIGSGSGKDAEYMQRMATKLK